MNNTEKYLAETTCNLACMVERLVGVVMTNETGEELQSMVRIQVKIQDAIDALYPEVVKELAELQKEVEERGAVYVGKDKSL